MGEEILRDRWRKFRTLGVVLGCRHADSSIPGPDGTRRPREHSCDYTPSAVPGCLAQHLWLADGSSLHDHLGPGHTPLATDGADDAQSLLDVAARRGFPASLLAPDEHRLRGLCGARFALIPPRAARRVAWRHLAGPDIPAGPGRGFWLITQAGGKVEAPPSGMSLKLRQRLALTIHYLSQAGPGGLPLAGLGEAAHRFRRPAWVVGNGQRRESPALLPA